MINYLDSKMQNVINKNRILGKTVLDIPTACKYECKLIEVSDDRHILYIPSCVTTLNSYSANNIFTSAIKNIKGCLKVVGGSGLNNTIGMFKGCSFNSFDFSEFNIHNVEHMDLTFSNCHISSINIGELDTSNVKTMLYMFCGCVIDNIDMSALDMHNIRLLNGLFSNCSAKNINLTSLNNIEIASVTKMFMFCDANIITENRQIIKEYELNKKEYPKTVRKSGRKGCDLSKQ